MFARKRGFPNYFNMKIWKMRKAGKKRTIGKARKKKMFEIGSKMEFLKLSFTKARKTWFVFLCLFSINEGIKTTKNLNCH